MCLIYRIGIERGLKPITAQTAYLSVTVECSVAYGNGPSCLVRLWQLKSWWLYSICGIDTHSLINMEFDVLSFSSFLACPV